MSKTLSVSGNGGDHNAITAITAITAIAPTAFATDASRTHRSFTHHRHSLFIRNDARTSKD